MKKIAPTSQPDYLLNVGDNFYPGGYNYHCASSGADPAADPSGQFANMFDAVYGDLAKKPWLSVLGNHDYGGIGFVQGWDLQIFETWKRDNWILPGQFWSMKAQYQNFAVAY